VTVPATGFLLVWLDSVKLPEDELSKFYLKNREYNKVALGKDAETRFAKTPFT